MCAVYFMTIIHFSYYSLKSIFVELCQHNISSMSSLRFPQNGRITSRIYLADIIVFSLRIDIALAFYRGSRMIETAIFVSLRHLFKIWHTEQRKLWIIVKTISVVRVHYINLLKCRGKTNSSPLRRCQNNIIYIM